MLTELFPSPDDVERALFASVPDDRPWEALIDLAGRVRTLTGRGAALAAGARPAAGAHIACEALLLGEGAVVEPTALFVGGPV